MIEKIERYFYLPIRYPWPGCKRAEVPVAIIKGPKGRLLYQLKFPDNPGYGLKHHGWRLYKRLPDRKTKLWRKRRAKGGVL